MRKTLALLALISGGAAPYSQSVFAGESVCPLSPLGVLENLTADDRVFVSTNVASSGGNDNVFFDIATDQAMLRARAALRLDNRVPKDGNQGLRGVQIVGVCRVGNRVYATVSISEKSAQQAIKLHEALGSSFKRAPTPTESYLRLYD